VRLWAVYSDRHTEIDIFGDRDGLRALAAAAAQVEPLELALDDPPAEWQEEGRPLTSIRVAPGDGRDARICFEREGSALVMSGSSEELARIVGGAITSLAAGPASQNRVSSHVHLDPTSDPDRRFYSPDSGSLVVGFGVTED
jgi:hypothetical protein